MSKYSTNGMSLRLNDGLMDALNFRRQFHEFSYQEIVAVDTEVNATRVAVMVISLLLLSFLVVIFYFFSGLFSAEAANFSFTMSDHKVFVISLWSFILAYVFVVSMLQPDQLLVLETRGGKIWRTQVTGEVENKIKDIERAKGVVNKLWSHGF